MKKSFKIILGILVLILISVLSFFCGSCQTERKYKEVIEELKENPQVAPAFYATIDDIDGDMIFITGLEMNDINHRGSYYFRIDEDTSVKWNNSDITVNELQAGNVISVAYTGEVWEESPAYLEKVLAVTLLEEELVIQETDPWIKDISLSEAEESAGFKLELPEVVADSYVAAGYQAIADEVIEVTYVYEDYTVIIKRAVGENRNYIDHSVTYENVSAEQYEGDLAVYDITHFSNESAASHTLISGNGYTWTIYAPNGYWEDSEMEFIHEICQ